MENFLNTAVVWFIVGFVFLLLEFVVPGVILFFFGVGAWIVALLSLFTDISINAQLIIFLVASAANVLLFRKWVANKLWIRKSSNALIEDEFIGKTGRAESAILPGQNGKVDFKGTSWQAASEDFIEKGEDVTIIGNESILLIVKSTKNL